MESIYITNKFDIELINIDLYYFVATEILQDTGEFVQEVKDLIYFIREIFCK